MKKVNVSKFYNTFNLDIKNIEKFTFIDLFAGIGGIRLPFEKFIY